MPDLGHVHSSPVALGRHRSYPTPARKLNFLINRNGSNSPIALARHHSSLTQAHNTISSRTKSTSDSLGKKNGLNMENPPTVEPRTLICDTRDQEEDKMRYDENIIRSPSSLSICTICAEDIATGSFSTICTKDTATNDGDNATENNKKAGNKEEQVQKTKRDERLEEKCEEIHSHTFPEEASQSGVPALVGDTESIVDDILSVFVLNHVADDINHVSDNEIVFSDSLLKEIKYVENSLLFIETKEFIGDELVSNIKPHLLEHQTLSSSASKDTTADYHRDLFRAVALKARLQSMKAEIELKRIELESLRVDEEMMDDYDYCSEATHESEEGFFGFLWGMFKFQKRRRRWDSFHFIDAGCSANSLDEISNFTEDVDESE